MLSRKAMSTRASAGKRWDRFAGFLEDGRICLSNNAAERALRGFVMPVSFCTSFSSI
jgi:hypothetical protein